MAAHGPINGVKISGMHSSPSSIFYPRLALSAQNRLPTTAPIPLSSSHGSYPLHWRPSSLPSPAVDDPRKVVKVVAQDGKTGDTRDLAYTNCKVIGNGSFGIVFQAKLLDEQPPASEIAIKKVLQDKRFKVSPAFVVILRHYSNPLLFMRSPSGYPF